MTDASTNEAETFLFYCDMTALTPEQRTTHQQLIGLLFGPLLAETRELPDGYAYRFAAAQYDDVTDCVTNERRCCPFLTFTLIVMPADGPIWLHLTAPGDVKPFLREELGAYVAASGGAA